MASIALVDSRRELSFHRAMLSSQMVAILWLTLCGIFMLAVEHYFPGFFDHPNLRWSVSTSTLARFWPLFAYAAGMAMYRARSLRSTRNDEAIFWLSAVSSILAGIWEEIGYRWIFVCTAMVSLVFLNLLLGHLAWLIGLGMLIVGAVIMVAGWGKGNGIPGLMLVLGGCVILFVALSLGHRDPVFWFYQTVMVPIVNFVTLGTMKDILHSSTIPALFVFGMISANGKFSDGHKYQGWKGKINSWIIGFVMMNAVIRYGIGTAVSLHAIYDLEFDVIRYIGRKWAKH